MLQNHCFIDAFYHMSPVSETSEGINDVWMAELCALMMQDRVNGFVLILLRALCISHIYYLKPERKRCAYLVRKNFTFSWQEGWGSSCGIKNISTIIFESKNSNFGVDCLGLHSGSLLTSFALLNKTRSLMPKLLWLYNGVFNIGPQRLGHDYVSCSLRSWSQ